MSKERNGEHHWHFLGFDIWITASRHRFHFGRGRCWLYDLGPHKP